MYISQIKLQNFRNYELLLLEDITPGIQIVYGHNAQGKTNLIEAIHICANGKSFRVSSDARTIKNGEQEAYLFLQYHSDSKTRSIEALLEQNSKSFKVNGIPVKNIKDMLGNLYAVVFAPEDLRTLRGAPGLRRAFLDSEISKIRPSYVDALKKYTDIIANKNALLRQPAASGLENLLGAYNEQLEEYIEIILKNRMAYVKQLNKHVAETHADISGGMENISISYKPTLLADNIGGQLEKLKRREMEDMSCNFGPHRDDMQLLVNDMDVRDYASQGQIRTLMLAMKLACLYILEESVGQRPILLLDDVFSELDEQRKDNLLKQMKDMQVFITTAQKADAMKVKESKIDAQLIVVDGGRATLKKL